MASCTSSTECDDDGRGPKGDGIVEVTGSAARRDPFLLIPPIIAAIFLGIAGEDFGFDAPGWVDPFMYFGYFWHYPTHPPMLDHDYKASRLPWILAGYALHWLGDPAAASCVL